MDPRITAIFSTFGLPDDANERDVRRAYARRLKETDAAVDPDGFQALRESYESALAWIAYRRSHAESATAPASEAPADAPAQPAAAKAAPDRAPEKPQPAENGRAQAQIQQSDGMARAVFEQLMQRLAAGASRDRREVRQALDDALSDPRLLDVDARFLFELGVASWLANGWQPGHDKAFSPAIGAFRWREDAAGLARLGHAGFVINNAIVELDAYDQLPGKTRKLLREPIRRLRLDKKPGPRWLARNLPLAEQAVHHFPHWLHIVTHTANLQRWREWEASIPRWQRFVLCLPARRKAQPIPLGTSARVRWDLLFGFFGVMGIVSLINGVASPPPAPRPAAPPVHSHLAPLPRPPNAAMPALDALPPKAAPAASAGATAASPALVPAQVKPAAVQPQQPFATLSDARKLAASASKGKADTLKCNDAIRILGAHGQEFEKGTFGRPFDTLMINCLMGKLAVFPYVQIDRAIKREYGRKTQDPIAEVRAYQQKIQGTSSVPATTASPAQTAPSIAAQTDSPAAMQEKQAAPYVPPAMSVMRPPKPPPNPWELNLQDPKF